MTDSLCERAIVEVVRRCGLILTASGYNTNIGTGIKRSVRAIEKTECPTAVVWDAGETAERSDGTLGAMFTALTVNVEIHARVSKSGTPDVGVLIGSMKADVKRAVMSGSSGKLSDSGGEIGRLAYIGSTPSPVESGSEIESMQIGFLITYPEAYGNPNSSQKLNVNP